MFNLQFFYSFYSFYSFFTVFVGNQVKNIISWNIQAPVFLQFLQFLQFFTVSTVFVGNQVKNIISWNIQPPRVSCNIKVQYSNTTNIAYIFLCINYMDGVTVDCNMYGNIRMVKQWSKARHLLLNLTLENHTPR